MLGAGSSLLRWLHRGEETQNSDSESISGLTVKQTVSVDEVEDFERKKGDFSLYTYYWSSADWLTLSGAVFGLTVAGVSNRMLGKCFHFFYHFMRLILETCNTKTSLCAYG